MIDKLNRNSIFLVVFLLGCVLRFYHFAEWSLSNDELSALSRLQFDDLASVIEKGVRLDDMHPIGVQVFLWFWTKLFGISEFAVRLPFVIMGCLTLPLIYYTTRDLFDHNKALLVLAIVSCSSFPILYSQLARPYAPGLFFSMLFVWSWNKILFQGNGKILFSRWYLLLIVAGAGAMYAHYFSFLFVGIVGLAGLFISEHHKLRVNFLIAGVAMFLLYIPSFHVMLTHFSVGGLGGDGGWLGKPNKWAIPQFLFYAFNNDWLLVGIILCLITFSLFKNKINIENKKSGIILFLLGILPVLIAYFYSIFKNPVYQYSILIFGYPLLIIAIVSLINLKNEKLSNLVLLFIIVAFTFSTVFSKRYYTTEQFAVFKDIAQDIKKYTNELGKENIEYTVNVIKPFYINYYLNDPLIQNKIKQYQCNENKYYLELDSILKSSNKRFFLHAWSNNYHAPELEFRIRKYYPYLVKKDIHFNSGIFVFSKNKIGEIKTNKLLFEEKNDFENNYWNVDGALLKKSQDAISGNQVSIVDSLHEYGVTYTNSLNQIKLEKNKSLVVELNVKTDQLPAYDKLMLVVEVDSPTGEIKVWRSLQFQPFVKETNKWTTLFYGYKYVEDLSADDIIKIYLYNPGKYKAEIDDLIIRVID